MSRLQFFNQFHYEEKRELVARKKRVKRIKKQKAINMKNDTTAISSALKTISVEISMVDKEIEDIKASITKSNLELAFKKKQKEQLLAQLEEFKQKSKDIIISEHAYLRYLQRIYSLDFKKLYEEILPASISIVAKKIGDGTYHCNDHSVVIKDNVVVTILEKENS